MNEYILLLEGKKNNDVFIKCKNLNEVEEKIYEFSDKIINFELYKAVNNREVVKLTDLLFKRFINILK